MSDILTGPALQQRHRDSGDVHPEGLQLLETTQNLTKHVNNIFVCSQKTRCTVHSFESLSQLQTKTWQQWGRTKRLKHNKKHTHRGTNSTKHHTHIFLWENRDVSDPSSSAREFPVSCCFVGCVCVCVGVLLCVFFTTSRNSNLANISGVRLNLTCSWLWLESLAGTVWPLLFFLCVCLQIPD